MTSFSLIQSEGAGMSLLQGSGSAIVGGMSSFPRAIVPVSARLGLWLGGTFLLHGRLGTRSQAV